MKNISQYRANKQSGFTLIELVVVIVILGILAATAAPKFINLQDDATTATLQAVKASMQSAGTLVHSKSLILGNQNLEPDAAATPPVLPQVTVNGDLLDITIGYPRSDNKTEWGYLLDIDPLVYLTTVDTTATPNVIYVTPVDTVQYGTTILVADNVAPDHCFASYTEAADASTREIYAVTACK